MKAMCSGTVAFGMVSIPVKVYSATESAASVSFRTLHAPCGTPVKQHYACPKCAEVVPADRQAKGFELPDGRMLAFEPAEVKALAESGNGAIEVCESVPVASIGALWRAGSSYYLGPEPGGERAYALLVQALTDTGRAAVAKWASRGKCHVVALEPVAGVLAMSTLRYAPEVRAAEGILKPTAAPSDAERGLARQLLDSIARDAYDATRYVDEVQARVRAAIDAKAAGQPAPAEVPEPKAQIIDLMEALKASLAKAAA